MTSQDKNSHKTLPAYWGGAPVFPDGPPDWPVKTEAIREVFDALWNDGSWGRYHGPHCEALIKQFQEFLNVEHVRLCSSGTAAGELALRGLKVESGDEVILAAYDYQSNIDNVLAVGAVPVLVDVREDDWQIDVEQIASAITEKTKAVIVSHLHGGTVDMAAVRSLVDERGIELIEDACQATGAIVAGKPVGTWGDIGTFSFGGSKLMTAGRGGMVVSHDSQILQRIKIWTERGNDLSPLSEMQAAVLLPQLDQLESENKKRLGNAQFLKKGFVGLPGIDPICSSLDNTRPAYYKLGIKFDPSAWNGMTRDHFSEVMRAEGIALDPGFRSLNRIYSKRRFRTSGKLKNANDVDGRILVLHHPILLQNESEMEKILTAMDRIRNHVNKIEMNNLESEQ